MKDIPNLFGSLVFNDSVMKARLPKETYKSLKNTIQAGKPLDLAVANVVANERLGYRKRCNTFYSLVPTNDWHYSWKTW